MFSMAVPLAELETELKEIREQNNLVKVFVCPELTERIYF
jgi:hypothetical protein